MEIVLKAVPVKRGPSQTDYLTSLTFGDLWRMMQDGILYVPNNAELPDFSHRKVNPAKVAEIARYIQESYLDGGVHFAPIAVNVQPSATFENGEIKLPYRDTFFRVVNGQHRCFGICRLLNFLRDEDSCVFETVKGLEIGMVVYSGLSLSQEQQIFKDQDSSVQRLNKSLTLLFDGRSPAVLEAKRLVDEIPQLHGNVELIDGSTDSKLMALTSLVDAVELMGSQFESFYKVAEDWSLEFWSRVATLLPWPDAIGVANAPAVVKAIGLIGRDLFSEGVPAEHLGDRLSPLKEVDWAIDSPTWGEVVRNGKLANTHTAVKACHRCLQQQLGTIPPDGLIG